MRPPSRHQTSILASAVVAVASLVAASALPLDVVLYNHSPSIPTGLYLQKLSRR
jgi:type IV secretory pathway protease TraF